MRVHYTPKVGRGQERVGVVPGRLSQSASHPRRGHGHSKEEQAQPPVTIPAMARLLPRPSSSRALRNPWMPAMKASNAAVAPTQPRELRSPGAKTKSARMTEAIPKARLIRACFTPLSFCCSFAVDRYLPLKLSYGLVIIHSRYPPGKPGRQPLDPAANEARLVPVAAERAPGLPSVSDSSTRGRCARRVSAPTFPS